MHSRQHLDFTDELARLLAFTARVAVGIRLHSAYTEGNPNIYVPLPSEVIGRPGYQTLDDLTWVSQCDVMWLSDSLHNLDMLSRNIDDPGAIIRVCDSLILQYRRYAEEGEGGVVKGNPKLTFERHAKYAPLAEAIEIFTAIKTKATAAAAAEEE